MRLAWEIRNFKIKTGSRGEGAAPSPLNHSHKAFIYKKLELVKRFIHSP
jgi:hypothetical protein